MSDPISSPNPVRVSVVGLTLLLVLVVLIRAPADAGRPMDAAEGAAEAPTEAVAGREPPRPTAGAAADPATLRPLAAGCIRPGSSRDEVRAVMGPPDTVLFGDWVYGRSSVTFGYGTVLDYENDGGNLRLCPSHPQSQRTQTP